jgi:His-Xaa-Ser system radical SAM maturase HxsB
MPNLVNLKNINKQKVGFFRFKQLNSQYLITNDIGDYCFLDSPSFDAFLSGKIEQVLPDKYSELQSKGFMRDQLNFNALSQRYAKKNAFLNQGSSLHIVVVTLRCDHRCVYCQAKSQPLTAKGLDMDIPTAQKTVDIIFESPSQAITIEFQGGEPLANFDTVKFIVEYARKKNKEAKKDLKFSLVSNLTFMNQKIMEFLIRNKIPICTSLDGPENIHNKYRITSDRKNTYKNTVKWLKKLRKEYKRQNFPFKKPGVLTTLTRASLSYHREIVDEYVNSGLEGIHLRPVSPFGASKKIWQRMSFSAKDFLKFYTKALDYIVDLNLKGKNFFERFALIFLAKIFSDRDPCYLDIRSPCGAGISQIAYNFNGDVYTCDEARMLSRLGDESYRLGNVKENSYQDFRNSRVTKTMCIASCLDNLPECNQCVYKPYCGVCPLYNYMVNGNIFTKSKFLCKINMGILDCLFERLQEEKIKNIFYSWVVKKIGTP